LKSSNSGTDLLWATGSPQKAARCHPRSAHPSSLCRACRPAGSHAWGLRQAGRRQKPSSAMADAAEAAFRQFLSLRSRNRQ